MKLRRLVRAFGGNSRGVSAIEFALIFPIFFLFIVGILEFGLVFYLRGVIEEVVREGARGAIIAASNARYGIPGETLIEKINRRLGALVYDPTKVSVEVKIYDTIDDVIVDQGVYGDITTVTRTVGLPNQIVRYTIIYDHEYITPLPALINGFQNNVSIISTAFVKNE